MRLPGILAEVAEIIGVEQALYLAGQTPKNSPPSRRGKQATLCVPTIARLGLDHFLVRVLGFADAERLCRHFGGEILTLPSCASIYRPFRDQAIVRMVKDEGIPCKMVAKWFGVTDRLVRAIVQENVHEEVMQADNDNSPINSALTA